MSHSRVVLLSARVAAAFGAIAIAVAAPLAGTTVLLADDGGSSQPPPVAPNGHGWIG